MAKASWLNVTPTSGSGDTTITNSALEHTGRVMRTTKVTVIGTGIEQPVQYTVRQEPKPEYVIFEDAPTMAAPKEGGRVTVIGNSNSSKLVYGWLSSTSINLPDSYLVNGFKVANAAFIPNDIGAEAAFRFEILIDFPVNTTTSEIDRTLVITAENASTSQIVIKQAAGDATLVLSATDITIDQYGNPVTIDITTNTSWTIS